MTSSFPTALVAVARLLNKHGKNLKRGWGDNMKQRLIDANTVGAGMAETWQKVIVKMEVDRAPTVDIESLPLVIQLRHRIKTLEYGLDILQNENKNSKYQYDLVVQELADVRKRLAKAEQERDAAIDMIKDTKYCPHCKNFCPGSKVCRICSNKSEWEYRGFSGND